MRSRNPHREEHMRLSHVTFYPTTPSEPPASFAPLPTTHPPFVTPRTFQPISHLHPNLRGGSRTHKVKFLASCLL